MLFKKTIYFFNYACFIGEPQERSPQSIHFTAKLMMLELVDVKPSSIGRTLVLNSLEL
jgi:hypothetical protein